MHLHTLEYFDMFAHYNTLDTVKAALLDHCAQTVSLQLDSIDHSLQFYSTAAAQTFKALRNHDGNMGFEPIGHLLKTFHQEQLHLVDKAHEDFIQIAALHTHGIFEITRKAIEDSASFAPPAVAASLNATENVLDTSESLVNAIGSASVAAIESFDNAVAPKSPRPSRRRAVAGD